MKDSSQPVFWLDVRKEYIIQNFDKMLSYLEKYNYSKDAENGDFDKTFVCLKEFVDEIFSETKDSNLCRVLPYKDLDDDMIVKIVAAYLLVCQKIGKSDVHTLSLLANRLLLMNIANTKEMVDNFRKLQFKCLLGYKVISYGFSWSEIKKGNSDFNINIFCYALSNTEFAEVENNDVLYFENKGVAVLQAEEMTLAPMNYDEYKKSDVHKLFDVCENTNVCVDKKDKTKIEDFAKLVEVNKNLMCQQNNIKPSLKKNLKTYDVTDNQNTVHVEVLKVGIFVYARTIDPSYNIIEGYVYIPTNIYDITAEEIKSRIKVGDILKVNFQENANTPFYITDTIQDYYEETAEESSFVRMSAMFYCDYKIGRRWITENGLYVNIRDEKNNDIIESAVANGKTISVSIKNSTYDNNGNFVINGEYELYSLNNKEDVNPLDFISNAKRSIIEGYLNWSRMDYYPQEDTDKSVKIDDARRMLPLAYIFYKIANVYCVSTEQRFKNLMVARMMLQMCDAPEDLMFINHEISYVYNIVRFAQGDNPKELILTHDECLEGNKDVEYKEDVIKVISDYHENKSYVIECSDDDMVEKLRDLVDASNILNNKISGQELNRIKKNIAATLGVGDMFKNNENDATYYGEENDSLEFKSSIVFPPVNKRNNQNVPSELTRQKWEILKAVCGFLNSMSGGEIILGVRDDGYSCGLKDDIEYLYKNGKIAEQSMDKFMLYVKYAVDSAFCDDCGIASEPKDVTHARVRYIAERNKEDNDVLHIQVSPYEYGVVEFKDKNLLPEGMSSSYQRSSNTTAALTAETKRQLRDKKLSERADADTQKIIDLQKAKKNRKMVTLKGYVSRSGKKDRNVEPYKILLDRKAVICYDVDKKKPREYKITRFEEVVITNKNWKNYREKYENLHVDLFDMLEGDETPVNIVLKLGSLPYNLLLEECNGAEQYIRKNTDEDNKDYPWILDTEIYNICGIGRFYIGLAYYIKIEKGEELKAYVRDYIDNIKL